MARIQCACANQVSHLVQLSTPRASPLRPCLVQRCRQRGLAIAAKTMMPCDEGIGQSIPSEKGKPN